MCGYGVEVKLTPTGPCLVEVGARCHGGEASWTGIAAAAHGYTQLDLTVAAYAADGGEKWCVSMIVRLPSILSVCRSVNSQWAFKKKKNHLVQCFA